MSKFTASAFLLIGLLVGCDEKDAKPCAANATAVPTFFVTEFENANCSSPDVRPNGNQFNVVIKTQEDYDGYFSEGICPNRPEVDFEQYFVLAGWYTHEPCVSFDEQEVVRCDRLEYRVWLTDDECEEGFTLTGYVAVVERDYIDLPVIFDVQVR